MKTYTNAYQFDRGVNVSFDLVKSNFELQNFRSLAGALSNDWYGDYVLVTMVGTYANKSFINAECHIDIITRDGDLVPALSVGGWSATFHCWCDQGSDSYYVQKIPQFLVFDPKGISKECKQISERAEGFAHMLKQLHELSKYASWKEHDLEAKCKALEKENTELRTELEKQQTPVKPQEINS